MKAVRSKSAGVSAPEFISPHDIYLFREGKHARLYDKLGGRLVTDPEPGAHFAVWAPNAEAVSVVGDFNDWNPDRHALRVRDDGSGVWQAFVPGLERGARYKYRIRSRWNAYTADKADPFALYSECPPATASRLWDLDYKWGDGEWMRTRAATAGRDAPMSIYEVHLGSWRRVPEDGNRSLNYREIAAPLIEHVTRLGFTHVELMPVMEHPFFGSWGYQVTGYFAPSARYGTPQDFMYLVDQLHQAGIGVILDWVPSHFPNDGHGLVYFDGTHLYEHSDPRQGFHPEWGSCIFNYGRDEVRGFLMSSAHVWLDEYHADGLRVDAVASMLYLDYARREGEWVPNRYGGRENLEAVRFLKDLNEGVYRDFPEAQTIAEESTAWPMVSRPVYAGGLGFGYKWNMGWMHDTLKFLALDPVHRKYHHDQVTFSAWYAFDENFVLSLSHDEVVHGKGSLVRKMPGDEWQRFANLRLLYGYMWAHPGKKLIFMGDEFGQVREWAHDESLEWHVLEHPFHSGMQACVSDLNRAYRDNRAMYEQDCESPGFEWVEAQDRENSVLSFLRRGRSTSEVVLVVCNFTPVVRAGYRVGVPRGGHWKEIINTDAGEYGGSGVGNMGGVEAQHEPWQGREWSLNLVLPPLSVLWLKSPPGA